MNIRFPFLLFIMGVVVLSCALLGVHDTAYCDSFPGLNGKIAYTSNRNSTFLHTHLDIFVINPDGTGETQLTTDSLCFQPSWSADGSKIVFTQYGEASGALKSRIWVMN